jgi:DNA-binding HxlR family transcriptional regulator
LHYQTILPEKPAESKPQGHFGYNALKRMLSKKQHLRQIKILLHSGEGSRGALVIGDRWSQLILRDAFLGARRFEQFRRLTGAARGTLTARLGSLVRQGLLYRDPMPNRSRQHEYRLTDKGRAVYPIALNLWNWECHWGGEFGLPRQLIHKSCGRAFQPLTVCSRCGEALDPHAVSFKPGPGAKAYATRTPREQRRRERAAGVADGVDTTMFHSFDTIGDRWSSLLLATLMFGLHRYDDIHTALGIASNTLADRLRRFLAAGVIEQQLYCERPPRYEYHLTKKGWDLYPFVIALHEWARVWIPSPQGPALLLRHRTCGHTLRSRCVCDQCHEVVEPRDVAIRGAKARPGR